MRLASRSGLIATTLAIGAIAAPSAQAGLFSNGADPKGADQQEAQSFLRIYSHPASTPTVVATHDQATIARDQLGDSQLSAALLRQAQLYGSHITSTATRVVSTANPPGFQYGDAAIGAGVMAGLVLLGMAGTLTVRRRTRTQPRHP
jgi:hypothetical protein